MQQTGAPDRASRRTHAFFGANKMYVYYARDTQQYTRGSYRMRRIFVPWSVVVLLLLLRQHKSCNSRRISSQHARLHAFGADRYRMQKYCARIVRRFCKCTRSPGRHCSASRRIASRRIDIAVKWALFRLNLRDVHAHMCEVFVVAVTRIYLCTAQRRRRRTGANGRLTRHDPPGRLLVTKPGCATGSEQMGKSGSGYLYRCIIKINMFMIYARPNDCG